MKLSFVLGETGFIPVSLETTCFINFENGSITASHLVARATIPGISRELFLDAVKEAESNCPVSRALKIPITIESVLIV